MQTSSSLRVVHVTFGLDVGGLEKLLLEFARSVDPNRSRLVFVSLGSNGSVGDDLRHMGWPVICLHKPGGFRMALVWQLARIYRNVRADVVHTHDARALIYGAPAARLAGVCKVFHTQHGQGLGLSRRQLWLVRRAASALTRYVCVSRDARQIAEEEFGVPAAKLCTIYNGIGIERFADVSADDPGRRGPLTTVARLSPEKGIDTLLEAVAMASEKAPDLHVEIAGDGPCRDSLQRQCAALGLEGRVKFLGQVDDVPGLLQKARLFVLPSNSEGIALTLLEAMAARVAVIATNVGGSAEVVVHGQTGLLTPPRDPQAMAQAIVRLWLGVDERLRIAEAGQWRVREAFQVERMVRDYDALYRGLPLVPLANVSTHADPPLPVAP